MGVYDYDRLRANQNNQIFTPHMSEPERQARLDGWGQAVKTTIEYKSKSF